MFWTRRRLSALYVNSFIDLSLGLCVYFPVIVSLQAASVIFSEQVARMRKERSTLLYVAAQLLHYITKKRLTLGNRRFWAPY